MRVRVRIKYLHLPDRGTLQWRIDKRNEIYDELGIQSSYVSTK